MSMRTLPVMATLLVALMLVPLSSAELTFSAGTAPTLIPDGTAQTLIFSATLSCDEFGDASTIEGQGEVTRTVTFTYPTGFSGPASADVVFNGQSCIPPEGDPSGDVVVNNLTVEITPNAGASGMKPLDVALASGDATGAIPFKLAYKPGYALIVDQTFPVEVSKDPETGEWIPVEFTGTISISSNADTMVMMSVTSDEKQQFGNIDGLFVNSPHIFRDLTTDQIENGIEKEVAFKYTPTSDDWAQDTLTFTTWSHFLNDGEMKTTDDVVTWTFTNAEFDGEESNGAPGFEASLLVVSLIGAAAIIGRRRE
jgi:hypothetical protein